MIQDLLAKGLVVFDGAMGTELYGRGVFTNRSYDELCLSLPELVRAVHQDYAAAGAEVLTTNSFGANRRALDTFGLGESTEAINRTAVALAREVADASSKPILVAASVGPVRQATANKGEDPDAILAEQTACLVDAGADFIFFETQPSRDELERCARIMQGHPGTPYVLSFAVYADCESGRGESLEYLMAPLPSQWRQPAAWGMNCGVGPDALLTAAERAVRLTELPLIVQPNAGTAKEVGGRQIYMSSPSYIASYAQRYFELGVRGVGGCCGTAPEHIEEVARRLKPLARTTTRMPEVTLAEGVAEQEPMPFAERSRLAGRLAAGKWITTVEILPPRGYDLTATLAKASRLHHAGVDALNLPDGPRASSRLSPLITALRVQEETRIEVILHFCCRDRNLIGMQADLLACAACDIANILFVTGDPPKLGNYPFASGVFDVDSIGLCGIQKHLNQGIDLGGQALNPKTAAVIGVGVDPTALDLEREIRRFEEKAAAGAEFAITQPVFDTEALLSFLDRIDGLGVPVIAGIWPLANYRNASFLQNEIPGINIPDAVMERMAAAESKEAQRKTGIAIAREMVEKARDRIAGIQVSAPFGNVETALAVIQE